MPAHHAQPARPASPPVPLVGVLLTLFMIAVVCLLTLGAANSSIEPGDGWSATTPVTAQVPAGAAR